MSKIDAKWTRKNSNGKQCDTAGSGLQRGEHVVKRRQCQGMRENVDSQIALLAGLSCAAIDLQHLALVTNDNHATPILHEIVRTIDTKQLGCPFVQRSL